MNDEFSEKLKKFLTSDKFDEMINERVEQIKREGKEKRSYLKSEEFNEDFKLLHSFLENEEELSSDGIFYQKDKLIETKKLLMDITDTLITYGDVEVKEVDDFFYTREFEYKGIKFSITDGQGSMYRMVKV